MLIECWPTKRSIYDHVQLLLRFFLENLSVTNRNTASHVPAKTNRKAILLMKNYLSEYLYCEADTAQLLHMYKYKAYNTIQ